MRFLTRQGIRLSDRRDGHTRGVVSTLLAEWTTILYGVAILCLLGVVFGLRRLISLRMADRVIRDPMTGAYTPDFIHEIYQTELRRAERTGVPFSIAFISIRDTGKALVDVPVALARWLKQNLRGCDYVGRLEPNRFVIILPETWDEDARSVAVRIHAAFKVRGGQDGQETVACDVAVETWRPDAPDVWNGASRQLQRLVATPAS
jgi:diguanylate cyclase (GGDEF)-like protein